MSDQDDRARSFTTWLRSWFRPPPDPDIDRLIAANRASPVPGAEAADWGKINRAGGRRWAETLRAQRRQRGHGDGSRVVRFGRGD